MDGGVGEGNAALGHAEEFESLLGRNRDLEGGRVGKADVFGGRNHDASGDKTWVFSGVEHFCKPVEGGIGIRAADRFDKGRDCVVVLVTVGVVEDRFLLDRLPGDGEVDDDFPINWWCG